MNHSILSVPRKFQISFNTCVDLLLDLDLIFGSVSQSYLREIRIYYIEKKNTLIVLKN